MSDTTMYLVFSNPVDESQEQAFNDWYETVHLPEVLSTPGMVSAQRYKLRETKFGRMIGEPAQRYLVVYEMDDDPDAVMERITEAHTSGALHMHDSLDLSSVASSYWSPEGPVREAKA